MQGKTIHSEGYEMKSTNFQPVASAAAMDKREFLGEVERILQLDLNTLRGPEVLGNHGWDSIAVITFQAFLDDRLGVTIDCGRIAACNTFDDLFQLTVNCEKS
jgi:acyl carrier protein